MQDNWTFHIWQRIVTYQSILVFFSSKSVSFQWQRMIQSHLINVFINRKFFSSACRCKQYYFKRFVFLYYWENSVTGKPVDEFSDVRVFGELAILYNAPRKATVKALTAGKVWVLDQQVYHHITVGHYIQDQDEVMDILKRNEMLKVAGETVLLEVASLLRTEIFSGGEKIVRQGDIGKNILCFDKITILDIKKLVLSILPITPVNVITVTYNRIVANYHFYPFR